MNTLASELSHRMLYREFREYQAFLAIEPYGAIGDDLRINTLCSIVAAAVGSREPTADLFPSLREFGDGDQTPAEQYAIMRAIAGK